MGFGPIDKIGGKVADTFTGGSASKCLGLKDIKNALGGVLGGVLETAADFDPGPARGLTYGLANKVEENPFSTIGAAVGLYFGGLHGAQAVSELGGMLDQAADVEAGETVDVAQSTFYTNPLDYIG